MSASTEKLLEEITLTEQAIVVAFERGHDPKPLQENLQYLQQKLAICNKALTEGKKILVD